MNPPFSENEAGSSSHADFHEPPTAVKLFFSAQRAAVVLGTSRTTRLPYAFNLALTGLMHHGVR
jgi:hypothetical protein